MHLIFAVLAFMDDQTGFLQRNACTEFYIVWTDLSYLCLTYKLLTLLEQIGYENLYALKETP